VKTGAPIGGYFANCYPGLQLSTGLAVNFSFTISKLVMEDLMDKTLIVQGVANKLFATETALDNAIVEASNLMTGIIEARKELRVSAVFADETQSKVAEAIATLASARRSIVQAHHEMSTDKLRLGVRTKLIGVVDKPPQDGGVRSHLRDVG
jgi:hypothetical protein